MRIVLLVSGLVLVAACTPAAAEAPDSNNPAHCIAGFHYAAYAFKAGKQPNRAIPMMARAVYEFEKLKASGVQEGAARAQSIAFTKKYANDHAAMMSLVRACGSGQDADPKYKAALPRLFALASQMSAGL